MQWTEQDAKDACRLLAELDKRSKRRKAAGSLGVSPDQFTDQPLSPAEKADGASMGSGTLKRRPQLTPAVGGHSGDHTIEGVADGGLVTGGVSGPVETRCDASMRPPAQPSAGSYESHFTVEAVGGVAQNVRSASKEFD